MPVSLIVGPPNSGRAGEIQARLEAALDRDPVLVVPTADDASDFERRLCGADGAVLGASIRTFRWLADDIAVATGAGSLPPLSDAQRLVLVRAAMRATPLRRLAGSAARRGFAVALDRLIGELGAALVSPADLEAAAEGLDDGGHESELARLYAAYVAAREAAGRDDLHSLTARVTGALRSEPEAWGGRPVLLYGFDELTEEQLELVRALASACEVTIAVNYADQGEALKPRAGFLGRLVAALDAALPPELPLDSAYTASRTLRALDRALFDPGADPVEPDDGLALRECAGERGQAEAIAIAVARLLASGVRPDEVVIVLRHPDAHGPLLGRVLAAQGIPVAVEARQPLAQTAVGRGLMALAEAVEPEGGAEHLLAYLRARPGRSQAIADGLERRIRREGELGVTEVVAGWARPPRALERLERAAPGGGWLVALAECARELAEEAYSGTEPVDGGGDGPLFDPLELRAGAVAAEALESLAELGEPAVSRGDALAALDQAAVPLWRGPTEGRVRVLSPYRVRVARARHLFVAELQDGVFPGQGRVDPLLSDERRRLLGIPALRRVEQADEERYLFGACVSRPTERLWLCWRSSDEDGLPAPRSPFVDDVLDLLAGDRDELEERLIRRRSLDRVVPDPDEATGPRELARALAVLGPEVDVASELARAGLEPDVAAALAGAVERARAAPEDSEASRPGPLAAPRVLEALASRGLMGAGTLEKWIECPYRWFVEHELDPVRLDPPPEPMTAGSIVHRVLERLYRDPPGSDSLPREQDLGEWKRRAGDLLAEALETGEKGEGLPPGPAAAVAAERMRAQIERFLEAEAARESDLRPALLEASFGDAEGDDRPALDLGDLRLHGKIDRIDLTPDGRRGLIHDYKTGREVTSGAKLADHGKLQLQLYARAAHDLWGLEPLGGLYHPLGARTDRDRRGRGFVDCAGAAGLDLVTRDVVPNSHCADASETIEAAVARAREVGAEIRSGAIGRRPNQDTCPPWCRFQPICRLERSSGLDEGAGENGGDAAG